MLRNLIIPAPLIVFFGFLGGCGLSTPTFNPLQESRYETQTFVKSVAVNVHCQLRNAVQDAYSSRDAKFLQDWAGLVVLQLSIDEKGSAGPDAAFTNALNALKTEFIRTSVDAHFSTDALRELKITWYLVFRDLLNEKRRTDAAGNVIPCDSLSPYSVHGDLRIDEGMMAGIVTSTFDGIVSDPFEKGGPLKTIEHHVNFSIDYGGGVNPVFSFTNVVVNSKELFSVNRTRKDDLLITMGPGQLPSDRPLKKGQQVADPSLFLLTSSLPAQIGQAVTNGIISSR